MIYVPSISDLPNFDLWLEYLDVAGKRWVTSARYLKSAAEEYSDLSITSV